MSANEKDQNDNLCKKHASRCDKDYYRSVCPSKLSKPELEDLYYSLLENNLELKRTINAQSEKNRILSTKVQRMVAQTRVYGGNDCCASSKAVINEQKASIADIKKAKEVLADRVRKLSTQLCTAKQFLKQNPNARHCYRCYVKNFSTTSLRNKTSEGNLKSVAASAISLDQDPPTTRTAEANTPKNEVENDDKENAEKVCNENKCRTAMEEFKQKIADLEEELSKMHKEYCNRISQLENQVLALRAGSVRAHSEHSLRARDDALRLARSLRDADADKAELQTRLTIEKKKVAELEMRLKAAEFSQHVARTVEVHLATASRLDEKQLWQISAEESSALSSCAPGASPQPVASACMPKRPDELKVADDKLSKSDDSGFADHRDDADDKSAEKVNQWLMKRIAEMQAQLDILKLSSGHKVNAVPEASRHCKTSPTHCAKEQHDKLKSTAPTNVAKDQQITIFQQESIATKDLSEQNTKKLQVDSRNQPDKGDSALIKSSRSDNETGKDGNHERDVCNLDTCSIQIDNRRSDNSSKEQECCNFKEDGSNLPKPSCDVCSASALEQPIEMSNSDPAHKLPTTTEIMQQMFECGKVTRVIEEVMSQLSSRNNKEDSTECSFICHTPKPSTTEDHHSHQISNPLPVHSDSATRIKTNFYGKKKGIIVIEDINKIKDTAKTTAAAKEGYHCSNVINHKYKKIDDCCISDSKTYDVKSDKKFKPLDVQANIKTCSHKGKDQLNTEGCQIINCPLDEVAKRRRTNKMYEFDICHHHATICTCPEETGEGGITLRSCSGTLLVSTLRAGSRIRRCQCSERTASNSGGSVVKHAPVGTSTPCRPAPGPAASPHTYTLDSKRCRAATPDNTDNEISGMTDLPTENDASTPRELSPGERRTAGTSTESYSYCNEFSLSEGEVPVGKCTRRRIFKSMGECRSYMKEDNSIGEQKSSVAGMEEALHAISQELARCRSLLRRARPRELT